VHRQYSQYDALSYVWGSSLLTNKIQCGPDPSVYLEVTANAFTALRQLRRPDTETLIWVDAICINQKDIQDRNKQVSIMDQIYLSARSTIVHISKPDDASETAMGNMDRYSAEGPIPPELIAALQKFLEQPWFSRVWVLQEVILPPKATVVCGRHAIPWQLLEAACNAVKLTLSLPPALVCRSYGTDLWSLLCSTRQCAATDVRDKVYGILSLIEETWPPSRRRYAKRSSHTITPDHDVKAGELFVKVARILFE
jgi:hypothetical protein